MQHLIKYALVTLLFFAFPFATIAQDVYKTPSGAKYHLSSCTMVKNVSKRLHSKEEIEKYKLLPCKICKPPSVERINFNAPRQYKEVGEGPKVRCQGITQKAARCKRTTTIANGYCFQHQKQVPKR